MNSTLTSPDKLAADEWNIADSGMHDNGNSSSFEFPKGDRAITKSGAAAAMHHRFGPSKWDDAEKWLANPLYTSKLKVVTLHGQHFMNPSKQFPAYSIKEAVVPSSNGASHVSRDDASVPLLRGQEAHHSTIDGALSLNGDYATTRREADLHQQAVCAEVEGTNNGYAGETNSFAFPAPPSKVSSTNTFDFYPLEEEPSDMKELSISHEGVNDDKPPEPSAWDRASYVMPEPAMRSVSMRDMGTEMTPIASQEPSRTGTPIQATTPLMRSPVSSGSSTPRRAAPASSPLQAPQDPTQTPGDNLSALDTDGTTSETCGSESQMKTRQDIQTLGVQLGKINIVAWPANKEEEDGDSSKLLKNIDLEEVKRNVLEARAAAWEEAEQAKYIARFEREEAKIQAWENHEKAKAEAEMRRIEVKIEKIRSHAHEKLMNKLAAAKLHAEEQRAVAEARRGEQAAKTIAVANRIRQTGRVPSPMLGCAFCP